MMTIIKFFRYLLSRDYVLIYFTETNQLDLFISTSRIEFIEKRKELDAHQINYISKSLKPKVNVKANKRHDSRIGKDCR